MQLPNISDMFQVSHQNPISMVLFLDPQRPGRLGGGDPLQRRRGDGQRRGEEEFVRRGEDDP